MAEFRVIAEWGRYVLGEEEDGYGIWDLDAGDDEPVERFSPTDDGFDAGWARVRELHRADRRMPVRTLRVILFAGLVMWVLGMAVIVTFQAFPNLPVFDEPFVLLGTGFVMDAIGFRLAVAGAVSLAAVAAWRRWFASGDANPIGSARGVTSAAGVPGTVMIGALCVWIVSGLITPFQEIPSFEGPVEQARWMQLALVAQYVGFRVAVLMGVLIVLRWIRLVGGRRSAADGPMGGGEGVERVDELGEHRDE